MSSSSSNVPISRPLASSDQQPPFDSSLERNKNRGQRQVWAQYKPLDKLYNISVPGTLHWGVQVVSATEIANDEHGYIWELAQANHRLTMNMSSWTGETSNQKDFLGYTNLTDEEIFDHASKILNHMNTDEFNFLDGITRLYLRPVGQAHSLKNKTSTDAQAYDMLVQNCQKFAKLLKEAICQEESQNKRKGGFRKVGTRFWKFALLSSLSSPPLI